MCGNRHALGVQSRLKPVRILRHAGLYIGRDGGSDGAFIFADHRPVAGRGDDGETGGNAFDHRLNRAFVGRIAAGVQEGHDDAFFPRRPRLCHCLGDISQSRHSQRRSVCHHPLANAEHAVTRDQRCGPTGIQVVELRDLKTGSFQHILKVSGREQRQPGAVALNHSVDDHRGSLGKITYIGRPDAIVGSQPVQPGHNLGPRCVGARHDLESGQRATLVIKLRKIGERPAHIDANPIAHLSPHLSAAATLSRILPQEPNSRGMGIHDF